MRILSISRRGLGRLLAAGLAAGALIVTAAAVPHSAMAQQAGGTLKLAFDHDAGGFDPAKATYGMSHAVIEQVFSGLTALDSNANPYPDLAATIDVSDDGLVYTFNPQERGGVPRRDPVHGRGRQIHPRSFDE